MSRVLITIGALLFALVVTLLVFGVDPLNGVRLFAEGAFGDKFGVARTLVRTTPLLLCGLGITIAWKAGMYNVGGEGQYVVGGVFAAGVARAVTSGFPALSHTGILLASLLGGAALAAFAGWLQVKRGVQCVISTILLNFIAIQGLAWAVRGPLQEKQHQLPLTDRLPANLRFHRFDPQTDLHVGVFLGAVALIVVVIFLSRTKYGFLLRLVGQNPSVARANKIDPGRIQITAMAISGALCGLAAGVDYLGLSGQVGDGLSQNWGFLAIPVALLAGLNPLGVLGTSLYFGALMAGGEGLARFNSAGTTLVAVIQGVAVLGFVGAMRLKMGREVVHD